MYKIDRKERGGEEGFQKSFSQTDPHCTKKHFQTMPDRTGGGIVRKNLKVFIKQMDTKEGFRILHCL